MPAGAKQAVPEGRPLEAWAIESARDFAGMSREELAEELTKRIGRPYNYGTVREMERGLRRKVSFAEVSAVAAITGFPLAWFQLNPTSGEAHMAWTVPTDSDQHFRALEDTLPSAA